MLIFSAIVYTYFLLRRAYYNYYGYIALENDDLETFVSMVKMGFEIEIKTKPILYVNKPNILQYIHQNHLDLIKHFGNDESYRHLICQHVLTKK